MRRIGHRGAKGHVAENTIASFQKAFELGCDEVETDVWLTPEGRLVISQDPGGFRRGGPYTVYVTYRVQLADLPAFGVLPGSFVVSAKHSELVERFKSR